MGSNAGLRGSCSPMLLALPRAARCQQPGLGTATTRRENEPPRRACWRAESWVAHSDPRSGSGPPETTSPRLPGAGGSRGRGGGAAQEPLSAILWSTRRGRLFSCARRRRLPRRLPPAARAAAAAEPSPAEAAPSAFSFSRRCSLLTTVIRAGPAGILPPRWPHTSVACPLSRTSNLSVRPAAATTAPKPAARPHSDPALSRRRKMATTGDPSLGRRPSGPCAGARAAPLPPRPAPAPRPPASGHPPCRAVPTLPRLPATLPPAPNLTCPVCYSQGCGAGPGIL